jgi:hypothetical protein
MAPTLPGEDPEQHEEHPMAATTMRTAGQIAQAAGARLRDVVASLWPMSGPAVPCPVYVNASSATRSCIQGQDVFGNVKPHTTGGFGLTAHTARRHPERSP